MLVKNLSSPIQGERRASPSPGIACEEQWFCHCMLQWPWKGDKFESAQTSVAQILLARGHSLPEAPRLMDRIVSVGGLGRVGNASTPRPNPRPAWAHCSPRGKLPAAHFAA